MSVQHAWSFVLIFATVAGAQPAGRLAHLVRLPRNEAAAVAQKIVNARDVANGATPDPDNGQNFILHAAGAEDLSLMPGELQVSAPSKPAETQMQCGLFVLHQSGTVQYVPVVGPDFKPYSFCEQMDGMGLSSDPGPRPRLILLFQLRAAAGNHYDMPFVLAWDPGTSAYKVDYATSFALVKRPGGNTVVGARRLLAAHS